MPALPIALSTGPLTWPCADAARRLLAERGWEVRIYEADGQGGRALEADVLAGRIGVVLDLSLSELAAELLGVPGGGGLDRLTAAALRGVPQVIMLGELDAVRVHDSRADRRTAEFAGAIYLRTTPEENDRLGQEVANKASAARGSTVVLVPRRGLSALDVEGGPFWWPAADAALVQSFRNWVGPSVRARELDVHVNDPAFAAAAVADLEELLSPPSEPERQ
jgi:uncharacterized protein (UPF0261 family)